MLDNKENNNKSIINELNLNIEQLKQKKILENKNYQKLIMDIRCRGERNMRYNNSCTACRKKRDEKNTSNSLHKRSISSNYFYLKK